MICMAQKLHRPFQCLQVGPLSKRYLLHMLTDNTAYRYPKPTEIGSVLAQEGFDFYDPKFHVYSRYTQPVSTRAERVLGKINVSSPTPLPHVCPRLTCMCYSGWIRYHIRVWFSSSIRRAFRSRFL